MPEPRVDRLIDLVVGDRLTVERDGQRVGLAVQAVTHRRPARDAPGRVAIRARDDAGQAWSVAVTYAFDGVHQRTVRRTLVQRGDPGATIADATAWRAVRGSVHV